jgi:hypothetical protein
MFDQTSTITFGGFRAAAGKADITVRWPTDAEWNAHRKKRKLIQKNLGRGAVERRFVNGDADSVLYEAIKLNGAPPLSEAESAWIINQLATCDVLGVELGADEATVELQVLTGTVKHTVRIPNMDEVKTLQASTKFVMLPYNVQEIRSNLESSAALWDKCNGHAEGYGNGVPALHKDAAIRAVIEAIEQEAVPKYDESNF